MAATLTVSYTPQYQGAHRICFRTTQTAYCCYLDQSLSVIGFPKTIEIDLTEFESCLVDPPTEIGCAASELDGYVQPACEASDTLIDRVIFNVTYPDPTPCTPYEVLCVESGIGEIGIINPGYGWPVGVVPTVTVNTSGSGFGFASTAVMSCLPGDSFCSIDYVLIDNSGEAYFYLNELSVDVSPLPSCVSNELLINGNFDDGFLNWNVIPAVDSWELTPSGLPYYNIPVYGSIGGTIEQTVLTPGRTYLIDFEKVTVESRSGTVRFIVTAGLFSITGAASNQYMITRTVGDPDFDGPLSITLTCFGSSVFSIYADSSTTDPLNVARLTQVSVVELCEAINPELEVASLDDCATFTIPNCDGSNNLTEYQIQGTAPYAINVCSGGTGPVGAKYTITPNPTYSVEGPELVVNGSFTNDLSGWTYFPDDPNTPNDVFWTSQGVTWDPSDEAKGLTQDILTVGKYYIIDITLTCDYGPSFPFPIPQNQVAFELSFGTNTLAPIVFSGIQQSYQFNYVSCLDNPTFRIVALNGYAPGNQVAEMSCSYVSIREMDVPYPVSCCDCVKYDVINTAIGGSPIQFYYTDCANQTITLSTLDPQNTTQVCAVRSSVWPSDPNNNQYFEYVVSAVQDC